MKKIIYYLLSIYFINSCAAPLIITKSNVELNQIIEKGKVGFIDQKGKVRIKPEFDLCEVNESFYNDCSFHTYYVSQAIILKSSKYGVINWKGNVVIPLIYDELYDYNDKYVAKLNGNYGVIDLNGRTILPFVFSSRFFFSNDSIIVSKINGKNIIYNCFDSSIINLPYDYASPFFNCLAKVKQSKKVGLINKKGELFLELKYERIENSEGFPIVVKENNKWFFLSEEKEKILDTNYSYIEQFIDDYAVVKKEKYGVINKKGETIIPFIYDHLLNCGEGFFQFSKTESYYDDNAELGLINYKNDTIIEQLYSFIFYMDDIAELINSKTGKAGIISTKKNKIIIPFNFLNTEYYYTNLSLLEFEDENGNQFFGYINRYKKIIWSNNEELLKKLLKS